MKKKFGGKWLYPLGIIVFITLCLKFLFRPMAPIGYSPDETTMLRLVQLEGDLELYYIKHFNYPESLKKLLEYTRKLNKQRSTKDAWDNEIRYSTDGNTFELRSSGDDEKFDTEDDIIQLNKSREEPQ